ncbi:MAG: DUF2752 domain-containing protein [Bacteroidales bacterium]|nr:DUF2752 domain-containing protein [Bacteroidales bacterium]
MPRKAAIIIGIAGIILLLAVYTVFDPSETAYFPKCPFFWLTGLKCPGCGSQRAMHQLLTLHFGEAFRNNAFMVIAIPLILFLLVAELFRDRWPRLNRLGNSPTLSWSILAAVLLWWLLRNLLGI